MQKQIKFLLQNIRAPRVVRFKCTQFVKIKTIIYSNAPNGDVDIDVVGLSSRARQGRQQQQQNGDTYTLEIAFPAVKYVNENYKTFS